MAIEWKRLFDRMKVGLMKKGAVFLSTITFSARHIVTEEVPTAGTDGANIYYNAKWLSDLPEDQRIGVLAHETGHIMFMHIIRCGSRIQEIYNMAGDYVINSMLIKQKYALPKDALYDPKYDGWSTGEVYDDLILNQVKPPPNYVQDIILVGDNVPGDKGTPMTPQEIEKAKNILEKQITSTLVKASTLSKMQNEQHGAMPGEVERMVDELINPILPWESILHRYMDSHLKEDYSWKRPNRRYQPDFYLPSADSESIDNITMFFDVSGSIGREDIVKMLSEAQYIWERYSPKNLVIGACDTRITDVYVISDTNAESIMDLKIRGGGGTNFKPVFDYCDENPPNILLYFTDLWADPIEEEPDYPVIWLCYSNHEPAEIGQTIYYTPEDNNGY